MSRWQLAGFLSFGVIVVSLAIQVTVLILLGRVLDGWACRWWCQRAVWSKGLGLERHPFIHVDLNIELFLFLILFFVLFVESQITRFFLSVLNFLQRVIQNVHWSCLRTIHRSVHSSICRSHAYWARPPFLELGLLNGLDVGLVYFWLQFNLAAYVVLVEMFKSVLCRFVVLIIILMIIRRDWTTFSLSLVTLGYN